jgi:hypothetical protein
MMDDAEHDTPPPLEPPLEGDTMREETNENQAPPRLMITKMVCMSGLLMRR